jgi:uncharacterized tellurite resistance protein B-like protein
MIRTLKSLFEHSHRESQDTREPNLQLAAAALLVETARADFSEDEIELNKLTQLLASSLKLAPGDVDTLVTNAKERVEEATSLYEFTKVINDHCNAKQKLQLLSAMWKVAYADGNVDKYEEGLIRQVADLTYIPHSDYIHTKLATQT